VKSLLGPNGAEKQLFLYDCRLVQPNSGNIYLDDLNITDYRTKGPSRNRIFAQASVLEN
jgi:ABC-type lipopolysaccharide export system ATPase subunit